MDDFGTIGDLTQRLASAEARLGCLHSERDQYRKLFEMTRQDQE